MARKRKLRKQGLLGVDKTPDEASENTPAPKPEETKKKKSFWKLKK